MLQARYAADCAVCAKRIQPGELIARLAGADDAGWVHAGCRAGAPTARPPVAPFGNESTSAARSTRTRSGASRSRTDLPIPAGATVVFTDGACSGNPGPGGWAWAVPEGAQACGADSPTTNQRMEIRAVLEAVKSLPGELVVTSDSTYVVNCFRDRWWQGWRARNWLNSAKKPVANRDLWEPLIDLVEARGNVSFRWVKGHSGDRMNDLVDRLAVAAAAGIRA